jgi:CheY-like chemotaxis protein
MSVTDTGIGIRKEDMPLLFGNFSQLDTRKNRGIEGTGLGLAISKQLVELMDGEMRVESVYEKGSCFSFYVMQQVKNPQPAIKPFHTPCRAAVWFSNPEKTRVFCEKITRMGASCIRLNGPEDFGEEQHTHVFFDLNAWERVCRTACHGARLIAVSPPLMDSPKLPPHVKLVFTPLTSLVVSRLIGSETAVNLYGESEAAEGVSLRLHGTRLLVVDDIEINLVIAEQMLLAYGGEVSVAESGLKSVEMVKENDYDLVFMDHMMPEVDGVDATKMIRALPGERYKKIPIVALTANVVGDVRDMFLESGMNDFLSKPLEVEEMERVLRRWLPPDKWSLEESEKETVE